MANELARFEADVYGVPQAERNAEACAGEMSKNDSGREPVGKVIRPAESERYARRRPEMNQSAARVSISEYTPGELINVLAEELRARGLKISEYRRGDELREFDVTNPGDEGKGRISVGYDFLVTWEYVPQITSHTAAGKAADVIATVLTRDLAE